METRRRSNRVRSQSSDDESSTASSRATRSTTARGTSAATSADNPASTPQKRTRSNSASSKASIDTASSARRSPPSRTKSDASDKSSTPGLVAESPTAPKGHKSITGKSGKRDESHKLEVIPEVAETNDDDTKPDKADTPRKKSPKKGSAKNEANDIKHDEIVGTAKKEVAVASRGGPQSDNSNEDADDQNKNTSSPVPMSTSSPTRKDFSKKKNFSRKNETPSKTSDMANELSADLAAQDGSSKKQKKKRKPHKTGEDEKTEKRALSSKTPSSPSKSKPHQPIFDTTIHRLRFLKLFPKSIIAMTSSPNHHKRQQSTDHKHPQLLAISRQGGSVELVDPAERWITLGHVPGVRDREVDALVWVCGAHDDRSAEPVASNAASATSPPRLIGASRDGTLFQLDFVTQRQTHVIGSGAGGVFCMTSLCPKGTCCRTGSSCCGYFAAGCEDGTVKLYRVKNGFELVATLPSVGTAVLSLAWLGSSKTIDDGDNDVLGGSVMFAGVADGTIRRFDCVTSVATTSISTGVVLSTSDVSGGRNSSSAIVHRWKSTLRMVVENRGLREATKVWALQALSDGTIISGDSLGNVQFWDGLFGTMLQTFNQSESGADVLCLAVSEKENKVFASGVDSRVVCIQRQGQASEDATNINSDSAPIRKWINVCAHRKHTHDVRALTICHKRATGSKKKMELLVSGGIDTRICTYVTNDFRSSRPRIWFNWALLSPISLSRERRLISVTRSDKIDFYRLEHPGVMDESQCFEEKDESKCLLKTISIKSLFNLNCSTISNDGKFLAASDASTLYVFSLNVEERDGTVDIHPTKLHISKGCGRPSTAMQFVASERLVCATVDGSINILQLSPSLNDDKSTYKVSREHVFKEHLRDSSPNSAVISLDVSLDGKWFATARSSRGKGSVHVFSLEPFGHWWSLPEMEAASTCIKFLGEGTLAVGCSNNSFYLFNLQRRALSDWSHDMGLPIVNSLPRELSSRAEPLARILLTPSLHQKLILGAHGFFCVVDLDKPVPDKSSTYPPNSLRAKRLVFSYDDAEMSLPPPKKLKHSTSENNTNFTICLRYNNMLFQDFLNKKEMVIVEEPWMSILDELPDSLARRVYGI